MNEQPAKSLLTKEEQKSLLQLARTSLSYFLEHHEMMPEEMMEPYVAGARSRDPLNCFVTIHKGKELRGCIGTVRADRPLYQAVARSAVSAGAHDPRFPAMHLGELPDCQIEISVLSEFEPVLLLDQIEVGRDGLMLDEDYHRGLLLPQVAERYHWTAKEFVRQVFRKAGSTDEFVPGRTKLLKFQAQIFEESQ